MTNETTFSEKGRALFLTAMMVLSVVAMTASFAGAAAALNEGNYDEGPTYNDGESIDTVWVGQELTLEDSDSDYNSFVSIAEGPDVSDDPDTVVTESVEDGSVTFDTDELTEGEIYHIYVHNGNETDFSHHGQAFRVRGEQLDTSFNTTTIIEGDDAEATLDIDSDLDDDEARNDMWLNLTSDDLDEDELEDIFGESAQSIDEDDEVVTFANVSTGDSIDADFSNIDSGDYEFDIDVTDSFAEANASVTVSDQGVGADFVDSDVLVDRGDLANISIELDNTDQTYLKVGDQDDVGFETVIHVEDTSDDGYDQIDLTYNTYTTGQLGDASDEEAAWSVEQDDVDISVVENTTSNLSVPLAGSGTEYELSAGTGVDNGSITGETGTAFLTLEDYEGPSGVSTYTFPADEVGNVNDLDDLNETVVTETSNFAHDDGIIVAIEDYGLSGDIDDSTDELYENISLKIDEADVPNQADDPENLLDVGTVLGDGDENEYDGTLYIALDDPAALYGDDTSNLAEDFEVTVAAEDDAFFLEEDEDIELEETFAVEERTLSWDDDADSAPAVDGAELSGETNVAPGTEINTRARSQGNFTDSPSATVEDDGTFTATYQFGDYEPGTEFTLRAMDPGSNEEAEITSELYDADEANIELDVEAPTEVTVGEDGTLDVTVSNTGGSASDEIEVGVVIGGENELNENITLDAGEEWSNSFDYTAEETGDVEWSVVAGDNEETGTTSFVEDGGNESDSGSDTGGESGSGSGSDDGDESGDESGDDDTDGDGDGTPGFGVAVALAALLGAAMLALRKQN